MRLFLRVFFHCIKSASFLCILFLLCVESVWESLNSDFWLPHFCLPWPYTLSYRNLIYTGMFKTVRAFFWCKKLCWNRAIRSERLVAEFLTLFARLAMANRSLLAWRVNFDTITGAVVNRIGLFDGKNYFLDLLLLLLQMAIVVRKSAYVSKDFNSKKELYKHWKMHPFDDFY